MPPGFKSLTLRQEIVGEEWLFFTRFFILPAHFANAHIIFIMTREMTAFSG